MQTQVIKQYLYLQYHDDPDLIPFVDGFNMIAQQYVDWYNQIGMPIYTGLSGNFLDWVGQGIYNTKRPVIGAPSGAIYNFGIYDIDIYGAGNVQTITANDDIYKRVLTWKLFKGDGFNINIQWLKRRLKRFLIGANGSSPQIDNTYEISIDKFTGNVVDIVIDYPSDPASVTILIQFLSVGVLDLPFQYTFTARAA